MIDKSVSVIIIFTKSPQYGSSDLIYKVGKGKENVSKGWMNNHTKDK